MDAKIMVWVRSGGRCAICNRYLLDDSFGEVVPVGENAHIVGRKKTDGSPRGDHDLADEERDDPENLILVCREQHKIVDNKQTKRLFPVELLRDIKSRHEAWIQHVTGLRECEKTAVLRLIGNVRGKAVDVDRMAAARAVLGSNRYPFYPLSLDQRGVEIDLTQLANEGTAIYYEAAQNIIDATVGRLADAIRRELVAHVSVFAFARVPLLIYLGQRLDDTFPIDVYQRHREGEAWRWGENGTEVQFRHDLQAVPSDQVEATLIVNVSGTVQETELPKELDGLPIIRILPIDHVPCPDTVRSRNTLLNFERAFRDLLSRLEQGAKHLRRLHLNAAVPVSVAVMIGRVINTDVAPRLAIYELENGKRTMRMEIGK